MRDPLSDEIDELVNESIRQNRRDNCDLPYSERCDVCEGVWHGLSKDAGCPGAFASEQEKQAYRVVLPSMKRSD